MRKTASGCRIHVREGPQEDGMFGKPVLRPMQLADEGGASSICFIHPVDGGAAPSLE